MADPPRRVAVTGAAGYVGSGLVKRLEADDQVEGILATDIRPPPEGYGQKVSYLQQDITSPIGDSLVERQIDTVVPLAYVMRPGRDGEAVRRTNVGGTESILKACADAGVGRVVYLSSTSAYGAHPDNPTFLIEESPLRPVKGFQYAEDKAAAEALVREYSRGNTDVPTTILRCCPVMGPNADNYITQAFLKPILVAVLGHDPQWQLIHEDDLADVLALCALGGAPGLYNVAGEGTVRLSEMVQLLGRRVLRLPAPVLNWATEATWRLRLQSESPASGLRYIQYPWTASTEKIKRELGVTFRHTSRAAWEAFASRHSR